MKRGLQKSRNLHTILYSTAEEDVIFSLDFWQDSSMANYKQKNTPVRKYVAITTWIMNAIYVGIKTKVTRICCYPDKGIS